MHQSRDYVPALFYAVSVCTLDFFIHQQNKINTIVVEIQKR